MKAMHQKIIDFFKNKRGIVAVYLFGSHAKNKATKTSDVDVGIYFNPTNVPDFRKTMMMKESLASGLKRDVDLVVMNNANPILKHQVFKGQALIKKNRSLLNDFFVRSLMEYDDIKRVRAPIEASLAKKGFYGR